MHAIPSKFKSRAVVPSLTRINCNAFPSFKSRFEQRLASLDRLEGRELARAIVGAVRKAAVVEQAASWSGGAAKAKVAASRIAKFSERTIPKKLVHMTCARNADGAIHSLLSGNLAIVCEPAVKDFLREVSGKLIAAGSKGQANAAKLQLLGRGETLASLLLDAADKAPAYPRSRTHPDPHELRSVYFETLVDFSTEAISAPDRRAVLRRPIELARAGLEQFLTQRERSPFRPAECHTPEETCALWHAYFLEKVVPGTGLFTKIIRSAPGFGLALAAHGAGDPSTEFRKELKTAMSAAVSWLKENLTPEALRSSSSRNNLQNLRAGFMMLAVLADDPQTLKDVERIAPPQVSGGDLRALSRSITAGPIYPSATDPEMTRALLATAHSLERVMTWNRACCGAVPRQFLREARGAALDLCLGLLEGSPQPSGKSLLLGRQRTLHQKA